MITQRQHEQSRVFMENLLDHVSSNLDRYVRDMESLSMMPLVEEDILDILRARMDSEPRYITVNEQLTVSRFHAALMYERSEIKGYLIFCMDNTLLANTEYDVRSTWISEQEIWMETARAADGALVFLPRNNPITISLPGGKFCPSAG